MQKSIKIFLSLFIFFVLPAKVFSQVKLSDKAKITLLTCGSGEELYSIYGHTAIRVHDPEHRLDIVYNYGTFDFSAPNFYSKFIKGDLQYFVSASSYQDFVYQYIYYNRSVYEQILNLTDEEKQNIATKLDKTLSSEEKYYTYKFIDRNCTTMVADLINDNISEKISTKTKNSGKTYRKILYAYLDNNFYENLGINLLFGSKTDLLSDKLFLPVELLEGIENTTVHGKPLSTRTITVFEKQKNGKTYSLWNNFYTFLAVMLGIAVFSSRKVVYTAFLVISGLLGLLFIILGFYSFHQELLNNYNVLLFNPLFFILLYFIFTKNRIWVKRTIYLCLSLLLAYLIIMLNKPHLVMILPIFIVVTSILIRILYQNKLLNNKYK